MKKVPVRVRHDGSGRWRVSGDGARAAYTLSWRWGFWRFAPINEVIRNAVLSKRPLVITSGKKEKKFWRKVYRRIERLAP